MFPQRHDVVDGHVVLVDVVPLDDELVALLEKLAMNLSFALDNFQRDDARRSAEAALRQSETRFRDFAAAAGEYVWEADLEGRMTYISSRVQSVWGYSDQELTGRRPAEYMPSGEAERVREWIRHNLRPDGSFNDLEHMILNRQGETRWLLLKDNLTDKFYSFDASLLPDGGYAVEIIASDAPSHSPGQALTSTRDSARFEVDTTPPRIDDLKASVEGSQIHVTLRASDGFSNIKRAEYSVDAADWQYVEPVGQLADSKSANYDFQAALRAGGWTDPLRTFARSGRPLLGVCLGMQLLFECGDELGPTAGLGLIAGRVTLMTPSAPLKVPHVGWNSLEHVREHPLFSGVKHHVDFYFVHSYHCLPSDPADVVARCDYGGAFVAAVARANVAGTQFHPEKSQPSGLGILENFAAWDPAC
jgi:glutamine amidotransferase